VAWTTKFPSSLCGNAAAGTPTGGGFYEENYFMIRTAIALAEKGLFIFPCWPGTKKPRTAHGCKDATADPFVIIGWWSSEPELNIAVATGAGSGVFVVDVDDITAEGELLKLESAHGTLPSTVESITARGRHIWFKHPGAPIKNTASVIAPKIDSRGDGGFVLVPPSLHPSGKRYCWSVDSAKAFAPAPQWLLDKITTSTNGNGKAAPIPPAEWHALVATGVNEGARDCTIAKLAGYMLRRRIDPFVALELLQVWNGARCAPPLPAADIERIVDSICGRELRRRGHG
jgi:Bifunctional DNA primase/polymerase, N-terminal/Primase C terminal 1 (PriCT-1)